jgi:DNA repair ATPase RecN
MALNSSETGLLEESQVELNGGMSDEQVMSDIPKSPDGLAQAVAELFERARLCRARLVEITQASEAITYLTRLALELREPLKSFHDHIKKLASSFESMRTFRDELGVLAESFAPVRALHQQVIQMAGTVRTHLAEVADGLEPAKALQIEIADLSAAIESVSELQARFYELSEAFGDASDAKSGAEAIASAADPGEHQGK